MPGSLFRSIYSGLWAAAIPLLRRHKRLAENFDNRLVPQGWPGFETLVNRPSLRIWIQAASGGEAWLLHSLLPAFRRVLRQSPLPGKTGGPEFLCTTCTRQGLDVLEALPRTNDTLTRLFPLDAPGIMRRALEAAKPNLIVLLETELWPGLLDAARQRGVPLIVLNGRMRQKSLRAYKLIAPFWKKTAPSRVLAISADDAARFDDLFKCRVEVMPNIKFDRLADMAIAPQPALIRAKAGLDDNTPLVVLASVREEEEDMLLPVVLELTGMRIAGLTVAVAVAPRHMHRTTAWREKLALAGLAVVSRSQPLAKETKKTTRHPVFLWDSFGELQALYASADAAFVGGSLAPLGGQNFLEPPVFGLRVLVGPYTENFIWAGEGLFNAGLVSRVSKADELGPALGNMLAKRLAPFGRENGSNVALAREADSAQVREHFMTWLGDKTGGSEHAARAALEVLDGLNQARPRGME